MLNKWLFGCNYIPQNAINQIEMWKKDTFSPTIIDKELSWAENLGFNSIRVFLHNLVWENDPEGYLERIDQFLTIAHNHGIGVMFVLFDGVWNPFPSYDEEYPVRLNVHNSGWVQCPGFDILNNEQRHPEMEAYVKGIISRFKDDSRIDVWDIFNEPDNENLGSYKDNNYNQNKAHLALALLQKAVGWVREINPSQPITMGVWQNHWCEEKINELDQYMLEESDIISFHCYDNVEEMTRRIQLLKRFGKPMVCTEYMARPMSNTFEEILPVFIKYGVGAYNWGLVSGKSQTHCPWESWETPKEPEIWFHDIFHANGEPFDPKEVMFIQTIVNSHIKKAA